MLSRPAIPKQIQREVLIESGHRCAIPTCRQTPTEIAHIIPWSKVKKHGFDNLIALCPNCHSRFDKGEIDKQSMIQYKLNLSIINSRYGDLEQRVLRHFSFVPQPENIYISKSLDILLMYILEDGLIEKDELNSVMGDSNIYELTEKGKTFILKWINANSVE
jgi:HNH endonuclease